MRVSRWGNSLAVRLPLSLARELGVREGDELEAEVIAPRRLGLARDAERDEALAGLRSLRGRLPVNFQFDRDEANAR